MSLDLRIGALQQPRRGEGGDESGKIEAEHHQRAQAEKAVEVRGVGNEGRDEQQIDRQPRRAGHERRDQNGGQAVALVLNGARGHDGRNRAGIGRKQRDERFAVEADSAHHAVGDQRGAGQVAGIFENADEKKQQQNLREEDQNRADAFPHAVEQQRLQPADGQQRARKIARRASISPSRLRAAGPSEKTTSKTAITTSEKQQRSPDAVQQHVVDLARILGRERSAGSWCAGSPARPSCACWRHCPAREAPAAWLVAAWPSAIAGRVERLEARSMHGADVRYGGAELPRQLERVDLAAARLHQVAHVQQHQRGQTDGEHRRGEHQLAGQMQRVQNQQHRVGLGHARHRAAQHIHGDARVFRVRSERVDSRQIDQRQIVAAHAGHQAHALLDGDAGIVRDLLPQPGEPVEESGFAGIGRPDQHDRPERPSGR